MSIASERSKSVFRKTERDLVELSSSQLAETVHRFRTTTRRLQTLLEEIVTERDRNQRKLLKILDRIRRRAGKVRDLDAQLAALRSLKIPQEPRRKTQLTQSLIELRAKHEKTLRKMLTKDLIRDVRKRLKRAFKELALQASGDPLAVARQMLDRVARPAGPLSEDVLHQYRTVVKRARYAAEFAPKSTKSAQFIAEMKRMQDVIGNWHDWLTLTQTASGRLGAVNESSLVAALHNVTSGKLRHAVAALSASPAIQSRLKVVPASSEPARKPSTIEAQADSAA